MRMGSGVDFAKLPDGDFGIDLRRVEPGVSEHLLDEADVGAVFEHVETIPYLFFCLNSIARRLSSSPGMPSKSVCRHFV